MLCPSLCVPLCVPVPAGAVWTSAAGATSTCVCLYVLTTTFPSYQRSLKEIHITTLTNPCNNFKKSMYPHWQIHPPVTCTWRKKNLKRSWRQVVCIVGGSKLSQVWILGYMSDIPPICWLECCIMLENGWNRKQIETWKMTQKHSKVPKHVTLGLIFLLRICCCIYKPLNAYFVGVWQTE